MNVLDRYFMPQEVTTSLVNPIEAAFSEFRKRIDEFFVSCLQECGYKGDPKDYEAMKRFVDWYNIEVTIEELPRTDFDIIYKVTLRSKWKNILKIEYFKFHVELVF